MASSTVNELSGGSAWVVGSRHCDGRPQTLYVWAAAEQLEGLQQLGVQVRLGLMDIGDLHAAMRAWAAHYGATERQQAAWEEFAAGARVEVPVLLEPFPSQPTPLLLRGADSIRALVQAVPAGRPIPVLFARPREARRAGPA